VTREWLPQSAGLPYLNGGGTAAAVPPEEIQDKRQVKNRHAIKTSTAQKKQTTQNTAEKR